MKRPQLVHFMAIATKQTINVRTSITVIETEKIPLFEGHELARSIAQAPHQSWVMLFGTRFRLKVTGLNYFGEPVYTKTFDSDTFGTFNFKIPLLTAEGERLQKLLLHENSFFPGIEILLGAFLPMHLKSPHALIISDFDKTLVETKYSTASEMWASLRHPLENFPSIGPAIEKLKFFIDQGHQPFILTASPHFYENAIRDWLYKKDIYTAGIFLKDVRHVFSFLEGQLTVKDIKNQGFYKLDQLLNIINLTGIPEELVLMGDGYESDLLVYQAFTLFLTEKMDPWGLWNRLRDLHAFHSTSKQHSQLLNKIYQLRTQLASPDLKVPKVKILIRMKPGWPRPILGLHVLEKTSAEVLFYEA